MDRREIIIHMKSHPHWEDFKKAVLAQRPITPVYDYIDDNTDEWKARCAEQKGFDLCLTLFNIED